MNRDGIFLLSHVYDDLLLSVVATVATPSGESSVRKRQQLFFLGKIQTVLVPIVNS